MYIIQLCALMLLLVHQYNCETYTTKYDGVDLDEILASDRLLTGYVKCLLSEGPCTPDGKELKNNLPDAIENDCKKCTEKQRIGADKVMHHIIDYRPDDWDKLEKKYNADGTYKIKYFASKDMERSKVRANENVTAINQGEDKEDSNGNPRPSTKE